MEKHYQHQTEPILYQEWESSGLMRADVKSSKPPFVIPLPPPNVTGSLHLGHAAMLAIQDILIRYKKMDGYEALWIPGTDHAAIATENVVLRALKVKNREHFTRKEFLTHCRTFAQEKHDNIVTQMRRMGAWLDWSREAYTFDEARNFAVTKIFNQLYKDGLIKRGYRLINWSTGAQSVLSDDELEWEEQQTNFYYIQCGNFIIGTVRSETKCADSPVVLHPEALYVRIQSKKNPERVFIISQALWKDPERFNRIFNLIPENHEDFSLLETFPGKALEGERFSFPTYAGERNFEVITDAQAIDPEKGSGAMTISVNHAPEDYELALRKKLPKHYFIQKIDFEGRMTEVAGSCANLPVEEARKKAAEIMEEMGLLVGKDTQYLNRIPRCYRSGCVVEPMLSPQWFVMVDTPYHHPVDGHTTIKKQLQQAVRSGAVKIIPKRFNKEYFRWIDHLKDWCISRQIWWGHRIPVWYDKEGHIHLAVETPVHFLPSETSPKKAPEAAWVITLPALKEAAKKAFPKATIKTFLPEDLPSLKALSSLEERRKLYEALTQVWHQVKELPAKGSVIMLAPQALLTLLVLVRDGVQDENLSFAYQHFSESFPLERPIFLPPDIPQATQDEDTLDTWFSSALWPFSILGWPRENHPDYQKFYPTDLLETGWDILFFWVARMIMFGRYATGKYPFHTVYLHGMVTDEKGQKMSKSKGNGIDPLVMIEKYGADAVRLSLLIGTSPGNPIPVGENKIKGFRNFVNKLWNAGRFLHLKKGKDAQACYQPQSIADAWITLRLASTIEKVRSALDAYEISLAGETLYHFIWDDFCDWYLEANKAQPNLSHALWVFQHILQLLHPFTPFVTETLWKQLFAEKCFLIEQPFPKALKAEKSLKTAAKDFHALKELITFLRKQKALFKIPPSTPLKVYFSGKLPREKEAEKLLQTLGHITLLPEAPKEALKVSFHPWEMHFALSKEEQKNIKAALTHSLEEVEKRIHMLQKRLDNPGYRKGAPKALVEESLQQLQALQAQQKTLAQAIQQLFASP